MRANTIFLEPVINAHIAKLDVIPYAKAIRLVLPNSRRYIKCVWHNVKNEPFEKDRMGLITTALANSDFTSEQCLQLVKFYTFDNERLKIMKMMYPNIVDKEAFFTVIGTLTFSSNKTKMNDFIKEYEGR